MNQIKINYNEWILIINESDYFKIKKIRIHNNVMFQIFCPIKLIVMKLHEKKRSCGKSVTNTLEDLWKLVPIFRNINSSSKSTSLHSQKSANPQNASQSKSQEIEDSKKFWILRHDQGPHRKKPNYYFHKLCFIE